MSRLVLCVATRRWSGWADCMASWMATSNLGHRYQIVPDKDVLPAYQELYESTYEPILGYIHDDLVIREKGWDERVLREFDNPRVGLVGCTGALGHATPTLYEVPYHLPNLARQNFLSNMRDAEKHGARFTGERDVAVVDGMALFVRRSILDMVCGWLLARPYGYWLYSEFLCCETRRQGYRIRLVGIDVDHLGGKSSGHIATFPTYEDAHRYLWEHNRDVLPAKVKE